MENITVADAFNLLWEKSMGGAEDRALLRAIEALGQIIEDDKEDIKTTYTFCDLSKLVVEKKIRTQSFYDLEVKATPFSDGEGAK